MLVIFSGEARIPKLPLTLLHARMTSQQSTWHAQLASALHVLCVNRERTDAAMATAVDIISVVVIVAVYFLAVMFAVANIHRGSDSTHATALIGIEERMREHEEIAVKIADPDFDVFRYDDGVCSLREWPPACTLTSLLQPCYCAGTRSTMCR